MRKKETDNPEIETEETAEAAEAAPIKEADEAASEAEEVENASENPAGELLQRLDEAESKAKEFEDRYRRTVAELENFRRRAARDRDDLREMAISGVIEQLLPAVDNLRLGLQAADNHPEAAEVAAGFRMVADQLRKTLESLGLEELDPTGAEFDPNLHDCMSHQPDESVEEGKVVTTVRPGYKLKKRLLRAASVVVSSGKPDTADQNES